MAPEVDPSSSSPSTKDPHCMVVFDSCKVKAGREEVDNKSRYNALWNSVDCYCVKLSKKANISIKRGVGVVSWCKTDLSLAL